MYQQPLKSLVDNMDLSKLSADMKKYRLNWDTHWQEVADRCFTEQADFNVRRSQGERRNQRIYDSTATLALNQSAAAIIGMTMPKAQRWHTLTTDNPLLNEDKSVKEYFDEVTRILFKERYAAKSGFPGANYETMRSLMGFGTGITAINENPIGRGLNYQSMWLGAIYLATDYRGRIDTIMREFKFNLVQAKQQWGEDVLPKKVMEDRDNPYNERTYQHFVYPNPNYVPMSLAPNERQFLYRYVCADDYECVIEEGGYYELPYSVVRDATSPMEIYGRSPAMHILPEIKGLNEMRKSNITAAHMVTRPPLLAPSQGQMGVGGMGAGGLRINMTPGGITYGGTNAQGQQLVAPMNTGARPDIGQASIEESRKVVNNAFFLNLFQILVETPNMTATEVLARTQEKGILLAPVGDRIETEYTSSMIERELGVLERQGMLPEVPGALIEAGAEYTVKYESPISKAQRSEEAQGIVETTNFAMQAAAFDPSVLDRIDFDEATKVMSEIRGAPAKIIRSDTDVADMRAARAQQEQQQAIAQQAPDMSKAALNLAQAQNI